MTKLLTTLTLTYSTIEPKINYDIEKTDRRIFISILNFSGLNLFCGWVADQTVAERLIDICPNVVKADESKQSQSKCCVNLHDAVVDLFAPIKLIFLSTFFPAIFDIIPNR